MTFIVTCGCGSTDDFARSAYRLIRPNTDTPSIYSDADAIRSLASTLPSEVASQLNALAATTDKFAYLYDLNDDFPEVVDLLTGTRVA